MKSVLIVSDYVSDYGAEKILMWIGNNIVDKNTKISICTVYENPPKDVVKDTIPLYVIGVRNGCGSFKYFKECFKCLKKVFRSENYDYVLSFGHNTFYLLLIFRLLFHFKLIVSERNDPVYLKSVFLNIKRYLYRYADIVVFQTEGAKSCFCDRIQYKSVVIPNPVVIPELKWNRSVCKKQIASVGRLDTFGQKRQDLLLKAFGLVLSKYPEYSLNFYGDGGGKSNLEKIAKDLKIADKIYFHGKTSDVINCLLSNEIYVLTSDFEGIPNSLMEAMALGMPVVSTNCSPGGAELLIDNQRNGLLVKRGDINGIAEAIKYLIENQIEADKMADNARKDMELFSPEIIISKWRSLIK